MDNRTNLSWYVRPDTTINAYINLYKLLVGFQLILSEVDSRHWSEDYKSDRPVGQWSASCMTR